ncbi:MAG: hypothetical protein HRU70_15430 [Phycisphaeraceae bacterium]|nr:MAG: hypothetical protein HRU70_15430 [Phycisphaeraceae bacterium]
MRGSLRLAVVWCASAAGAASAQCGGYWEAVPGAPGDVDLIAAWDPDGTAGPRSAVVVALGRFTSVAGLPAGGAAAWDPATGEWAVLGGGLGSSSATPVFTSAVGLPNGVLVAAGSFDRAGGQAVSNIARWDGSGWMGLGAGVNGIVFDLAVTGAGDVVAVGDFSQAGGANASMVARWNGQAWSALGTGISRPLWPRAAAGVPGGVVVGGLFSMAGGVFVQNIARWNGSQWGAMGSGVQVVTSIVSLGDGRAVAGTQFISPGRRHVSLWDGSSWVGMGDGLGAGPLDLAVLSGGDVLAVGPFTLGVSRWNGSSWSVVGGGVVGGEPSSIAPLADGGFVIAGSFDGVGGGLEVNGMARWREGAAPAVVDQPEDASVCARSTATFVASSSGWVSRRWEVRVGDGPYAALADGPFADAGSGVSFVVSDAGGGVIGLSGVIAPSPPPTVVVRAVFENGCGVSASRDAALSICRSDFNCDGFVDFFDADAMLACFEGGECPPGVSADHNGDGFIDFFDVDAYLIDFEGGC